MDLRDLLLKENIEYEQLQKSLKLLGLDILKFNIIEESIAPSLLQLFLESVKIDHLNTRRTEKDSLRYQIEKLLKNHGIISPKKNTSSTDNTVDKETFTPKSDRNNQAKKNSEKIAIHQEKSLGIVKYIAEDKSHAFILPIQDMDELANPQFFTQNGYRAYRNELDDSIQKGQFIFFLLSKNSNRLSVDRIDPYLPVYIYNTHKFRSSRAIILEQQYFKVEIQLSEHIESGFYFICATKRDFLSKTQIDKDSDIIKQYGPKLFSSFLTKYIETNEELPLLKEYIDINSNTEEINIAFSTCLDSIEKEELVVLNSRLKNLIKLGLPDNLIQSRTNSINKISYCLWKEGKLPALPPIINADDNTTWQSIIKGFKNKELIENINLFLNDYTNPLLLRTTYEQLLSNGIELSHFRGFEQIKSLLQTLKGIFPDIKITTDHFKYDGVLEIVDLFQSGIIEELSEDIISERINGFADKELKQSFIESLPEQYIIKLYKLHPELSANFQQYLSGYLDQLVFDIPFVSFDIESDKHKISEFAWVNNSSSKNNQDFETLEQGIQELIQEINSGKIVVGQNIKKFDLPILQEFGLIEPAILIWDTLEIEMLLQPTRYSFALKTKHNAVSDSNLTLQLFKNQLFRITCSNLKSAKWELFLPPIVLQLISQIKENTFWQNLDTSIFEKQSNSFFRPEPTFKNIPSETFNALNTQLSKSESNLLVAPTFLWETLSRNFKLGFIADNSSFNKIISKTKVKVAFKEDVFIKQVLLQFIQIKEKQKTIPYYHLLPTAIKILLSPERVGDVTDSFIEIADTIKIDTLCISPEELDEIKHFAKHQPGLNIIVLGSELYALTSKAQLGNDFDFATIFDRLKNEPIWLQMSGGKNYITIKKRQCILLGIKTFPDYLNNLWLEKIGKGKFKIWCNLNFDKFLVDLKKTNIQNIPWKNDNALKNNAFIVRPDFKRSGYLAEQKRVNPESLFRKLYWIYQFKILDNLPTNSNKPKVLIVQDELEITNLSSYARQLGYFVPDSNASIGRQVEILHSYDSSKKLLIAPFNLIDNIIYSNYIAAIDFIWDSFLLYEKHQMLVGLIPDKDAPQAITEIDDLKETYESTSNNFDLFKLIKHHQPLIDYYYNIITENNPESSLFLCDTRFTDYHGIETSLGVKNQSVILWKTEKEYDSEKEIASKIFKPIHENAAVDFDINEAKEILRNIFLKSEDGDTFYNWRPTQDPCLNEILPAKKDLLISLPTGEGKSLLFQGPALFRSAFTNKLSIVISPLRALMQDQVEALWDKGFFNNVEFLSADKSPFEVRDIYRRIAGGEIALLYITPERFRSRAFENAMFTRLDADSGLEFVVFDEAHCISQWGQEFRPDYLNAAKKIAEISALPSYQFRKLHFSATISDQVFDEICTIMPGIQLVEDLGKSYNPVKDHISIEFEDKFIEDERLKKIAEYLKTGKFNPELSRAIIFVKSRRKTEACALLMPDYIKDIFGSSCNFTDRVGGFHAGMDAEDRKETYEKFKSGEIVILFATKAFGMGMDIPNIHFLAHFSPPSTFEDFLQEIGRAGRNDEKRKLAGFDNKLNPIKTLCLTLNTDFGKLKDQLQQSQISWHELTEIKDVIEKHISKFKDLVPDTEIPVAMPFDLYSKSKSKPDDKLDNKFRIALYWLERLERIKLGYFTITHLEFESDPFKTLGKRLDNNLDPDLKKICSILVSLVTNSMLENPVVQLSIASLRSLSKLSLQQLFISLIKAHNAGLIALLQDVVIIPTNIRLAEINYGKDRRYESDKYVAIKSVFTFARSILKSIPLNDSKTFDGEELDQLLKDAMFENIKFSQLPWSEKGTPESIVKQYNSYIKDLRVKRSKHAFTVIRLLGKTKHDTKMEKVLDSNRKILVTHTIFNGFHKSDEWINKINQLEKDSIKLLDYVAKQYFENNTSTFNWAKLFKDLGLETNIQYLSDLFFVLSVLGYIRSGGLLPTGIEVFVNSLDKINETDLQSLDKKIYDEFELTRKLRELKLIALHVFSGLDKMDQNYSSRKDSFIKKYFACNSMESLIKLLDEELPSDSPILKAFRAEAIKNEEDRLNKEQRLIYDSRPNQHINVIAGPGSGKTHTLTLRVARLVHHLGVNPDEILVLAYNRAVVSELKERLTSLFHNLGYDSLARRLKIFTFHGLAKRYCPGQLKDRPFDEWESILLSNLTYSPGIIMNQLGNVKYILVDEFQDINNVRISLLKKINLLTKANLFIIGDPNQSIYGYERLKDGGSSSPWPYYQNFNEIFKPKLFSLLNNHRSYPDILTAAGKLLSLPEEHKHLLPIPTRNPDENFRKEYVQIFNNAQDNKIKWWDQISSLLLEKVNGKQYRQIAILFRTNNEVFRGFQKIKSLNLPNIRIRIQGSLPYEFTRIRECHAVVFSLRSKLGNSLPPNFKDLVRNLIHQLMSNNPNWNHFYLRVMHALILDFFEDYDENMTYDNLLDFISELTYRDDGQLYKIYEKHKDKVSTNLIETEIVLTTMHKVKGLEFDAVIIPASFSDLPLKINDGLTSNELRDQLDEEKRLAFVAYSRARFRLLVFKNKREIALDNSISFAFPESTNQAIGIPVKPELQKLYISWAALQDIYTPNLHNYIRSSIKSGDVVSVRGKFIYHNNVKVACLSSHAFDHIVRAENLTGFIVNEVVAWSYQDTLESDSRIDAYGRHTDFANNWSQAAKDTGYILLIDFAGYGNPG